MATFNMTDLDPLLREITEPGVRSFVRTAPVLMNLFKQKDKPWDSARNRLDRIKKQSNVSVAFTASEGEQPPAGEPAYDKFTYVPKYVYMKGEVTGLALEFGGGTDNQMKDLLLEMEEDAKTSYLKQMNRVCYGDGTGRIALVSAVNGTTITVDGTYDLGRYLRVGMLIAIINGGNGAVRGTATISSVTHTSSGAANFVVDAAPGGTADNDIVVMGLQNTGSSYNQEAWGLLYHCDDGSGIATYQGQSSRSTKPWAKAYVMSNSGTNRPLSYNLLAQLSAHRNIVTDWLDTSPMMFIMSPMMLIEYNKAVMGAFRIGPNDKRDIGIPEKSKLSFDGKEFFIDSDCPYYHIFALSPQEFRRDVQTEFKFDDLDGSILTRDQSTNEKHKFWWRAFSIWNLVCRTPMAQGVLKDITETWVAPE